MALSSVSLVGPCWAQCTPPPEEPGACCKVDGTCENLLQGACELANGYFHGPGTDCATAVCPQPENVAELTSVLPAQTRGAMAAHMRCLLTGNSSSQVTDLLNGNGTDAALNEPFSTIKAHSLGVDMQGVMETALLAQTTNPQDGFILAAKLNRHTLADVIDVGTLTEESPYNGHTIYSEPSSGLNVTLLTQGILVVGQADSVASVIDVYEGDANNAETSAAVGPYLGDLASVSPVTFVYGLPGMYKTIAAGLTLNGSQAISGWLNLTNGTLSGEASFYTTNAGDFASVYYVATASYNKPPLATSPAAAGRVERLVIPIPTSAINKSAEEIIASRHELKMLFHIMEARHNWTGIATSVSRPWKNFFVNSYPPSVFVLYKVLDDQAAFSAAFLPAGFEMMPMRILESDTPAYFVAINYYEALGIAAGVRFEFNIMVKDPVQDKPRFLVAQALANGISLDPVNGYTSAEPVTHVHDGSQLISEALQDLDGDGVKDENYFSSTIVWPQASPQYDRTTREFVAANDYIFWGGGVCDHGFYSGSMHNRDVTVIPPADYDISNDTLMAPYLEPTPNSVYVYQNALDIVMSPWWNLDADYLDLDVNYLGLTAEEYLQYLINTKQETYDWMIGIDIDNMFIDQDDPITPFDADNTIPSVFFNYIIAEPEVAAFEAALVLPAGYTLEKTKILESDAQEEYYLTLNVYNINDTIEGTRAEWSVYVDDGNGREHFMVIDLMTEDAALDPMSLLNLPSVVEHNLNGNRLFTTLASSTIAFSATLDVSDGVDALQTLDWVEAFDYVCYLNGICDKNYFGEGTLEAPLLSVNPSLVGVSATTPWSAFDGSAPDSVMLRTNKQSFAKKAWYNVHPATIP